MEPSTLLSRRQALARLSVALGGALIGGSAYLRGEPPPGRSGATDFSADDIALLDEIGETIIPATDTPGARAVGIGAFMAMMVNECYDDAQQATFRRGLVGVDDACRARFGCDFRRAAPTQRTELLNALDAAQQQQQREAGGPAMPHYFRMMKQLTLLGYFTSEVGASQTLQFAEVPGRYDGNVPWRKGDRNWFSPPSRSI